MYNSLVRDHRAKSAAQRKHVDTLRAAALVSCESVTAHLFAEVQGGVGALYRNQRLLQAEAATLQAHTSRFARQSERWLTLSSSLNTALKELGDVHNWALTVQKDVRWVEKELAATVAANNEKKIAIKEKREAELAKRAEEAALAEKARAAAKAAGAAAPSPHSQTHEQHVHGADEELP